MVGSGVGCGMYVGGGSVAPLATRVQPVDSVVASTRSTLPARTHCPFRRTWPAPTRPSRRVTAPPLRAVQYGQVSRTSGGHTNCRLLEPARNGENRADHPETVTPLASVGLPRSVGLRTWGDAERRAHLDVVRVITDQRPVGIVDAAPRRRVTVDALGYRRQGITICHGVRVAGRRRRTRRRAG